MRKENGILKRIGALLLTAAMLLGMCPMKVAAEGPPLPLKVTLRGKVLDDSRNPVPVDSYDELNRDDYIYQYSVIVDNLLESNNAKYYWYFRDAEVHFSGSDHLAPYGDSYRYYEGPSEIELDFRKINPGLVSVCVEVDGLLVEAAIRHPEPINEFGHMEEDRSTLIIQTSDWIGQKYVGIPFTIPSPTCLKTSAIIDSTDTPSLPTQFDMDAGKYIPNTTGNGSIFREHSVNGTVRGDEVLPYTVDWPNYGATFTVNGINYHNGDTVYVASAPTVNVTIPKSTSNGTIADSKYLPTIGTWTDNVNNWTTTVNMASSGTLTVGNETLNVTIDSVDPTVNITNAYVDGTETVVKFDYTVGDSGIGSLTINDSEHAIPTSSPATINIPGTADSVSVVLISKAGKTGTASHGVTPALKVTSCEPVSSATIYTEGGTSYIKEKCQFIMTVAGVSNGDTVNVNSESFTVSNGTVTLDFEKANGKTLNVTDSLGRTDSCTVTGYVLDETAPTVTYTSIEDGFYNVAKDIEFNAEDSGSGFKSAHVLMAFTNKSSVEFDLTAANPQHTVTLEDGDVLTNIQVTGIVDNLGNQAANVDATKSVVIDTTAPKVTLTASDNIQTFKTIGGKLWAVLPAVVDNETGTSENVSITAVIEDKNMDENALATDGWAKEGIKFTKIFVVPVDKQANGQLSVSIPAIDKAGNKPASVTVKAKDSTTADFTWDAVNKTFAGTLNMDRRIPSEDEEAKVPQVTFSATGTNYGVVDGKTLYKDRVTFTATIQDGGSGLNSITFGMDDTNLPVSYSRIDNVYTFAVTANDYETNNAVLSVTVRDYVGNHYTYTHSFAIDGKKPVVDVTPNITEQEENAGVKYYNADVTYTVTADDAFPETTVMEKDDQPFDGLSNGEFTVTSKMNSFYVSLTDKVGYTKDAYIGKMVVDKVDPKITVTIKDADGDPVTSANRVVNSNLTYTFAVEEANLKSLALEYEINGAAQTKTATDFARNKDLYTFSVTLEDGESMTDWSVTATDWAKRDATSSQPDTEKLLVDTTAPVVTVTRDSDPDVRNDNADYFDKDSLTYTVVVADANLDKSLGSIYANIAVSDGSNYSKNIVFGDVTDGKMTGSFTLTNGEMLTNLAINVQDLGGNRPESIIVPTGITFTADSGGIYASENKAVVDTTAPTAELSIASDTDGVNIEGIYTFGGQNYLKLSGNKNKDVSVTVTMKLHDANLTSPTDLKGLGIMTGGDPVTINNNKNTITVSKTLTVKANETGSAELSLTEKDILGHPLLIADVSGGVKLDGNVYKPEYKTVAADSGTVAFNLTLDNRAPSSGADTDAPVITVDPANAPYTSANNLPLYNSAFKFKTTVNETYKSSSEENSGLDVVSYQVTDTAGVITSVDVTETIPDTGRELTKSYTIPVDLAQNPGETNSAALNIQAMDKSGNAVSLTKEFAVDNLSPRVSVTFNNNSVTNGKFFNALRKATVTVEDINLTDTVAEVTGSKTAFEGSWTGTDSKKTNTVTFDPGADKVGEYTMSLSSTDRAENATSDDDVNYNSSAAPNEFIIDRKAPTVKVTRTSDADGYTDGKTDYYNKSVTYAFEIQDNYLDNADGQTQKVNITYTVNGTPKSVSLPAAEGGLTYAETDGLDTYTYSFTLNNEDVLSDITIKVVDNAGNSFKQVSGNVPFASGAYNGNDVKVDTEAPVVKVVRTGDNAVQSGVKGYDFYGAEQTFTVTVTDKNLVDTTGSKYAAFYQINGGVEQTVSLTGSAAERTGEFAVTGSVSDLINYIQVTVKDAAGNSAVFDGDSNLPFGEQSGTEGLVYNGSTMIVDTLAPTAKFHVEGPVDSYYTNGSDAVFIKLTNPTTGTETDRSDVEVTAYLEVSDWNLSFGKADFTVKSNAGGTLAGSKAGDWDDGYKIHKNGTVVFSQSFTVPYNQTGLIELDLDISDMAGHNLEQKGLTIENLNGTAAKPNPLKVTAGNLAGAITLDRRQPTSGSDTEAPHIKLTPNPSPVNTTSDGRKLFNDSFSYILHVEDGTDNRKNAGLKSVVWSLENSKGIVSGNEFITISGTGNSNIGQGVLEFNETIGFTVAQDECNTCELQVVAEDYVGNKITYVEPFAVDKLKPRVKVEYDNNDVKNEWYFKSDRKATITVEDINFDASSTKINTQVGSSGWSTSADGLVHTTVCSYTVDGDYTFTMESTDLAGNATMDGNVTYIGAAPQKFTLDKTNPVIEVIYNPADFSGKDDMGTLYYNVDTTAMVKIKERNFRANDVVSEFNNGKQLSAFTDGSDESHVATVLFDQNNRYQFRIAYTDLAGNVAEPYSSPIFSVDTTAPVIDITEGSMTNEHLNIVADNLALQVRVRDQESNLEGYDVKITFQNNNFEWITLDSKDFWSVTTEDGGNTIYINFANIAQEKSRDGVYTVEISGRDYAGNVTELAPPLVFSLNRFGSSFVTKDPFTIDFLKTNSEGIAYHNSVDQKLVFQEINPNRVFEDAGHGQEGSALTLMVNGTSRRLQLNQDYTVTSEQHNEADQAWFVYTYSIDPSAFKDGGELRNGRNTILIYGEDEAGNQNTNESNTAEFANLADGGVYTGKIEFVLDTMPPIITTVGIESNGVYEAESQQMKIDVSDSTAVAVKVYLNDQELTLSQEPGDSSVVWMTKDETMGTYTVNVPQDNKLFAKQTLRVTVVDAANNEAEAYVQEFYVTTNPIVQVMNNIWLLGGSVAALAGVAFLTVITIRKRRIKVPK